MAGVMKNLEIDGQGCLPMAHVPPQNPPILFGKCLLIIYFFNFSFAPFSILHVHTSLKPYSKLRIYPVLKKRLYPEARILPYGHTSISLHPKHPPRGEVRSWFTTKGSSHIRETAPF
jgi:hypothetical protein